MIAGVARRDFEMEPGRSRRRYVIGNASNRYLAARNRYAKQVGSVQS